MSASGRTIRLGPCPCQGCGHGLWWNGIYWSPKRWAGRHVCPSPVCGARMKCGDPCARKAGHATEHRTRYALENASVARTGRARARARRYNTAVGSSDESTEYSGLIAHTAQGPSSRLYSEREGLGLPEHRRNA